MKKDVKTFRNIAVLVVYELIVFALIYVEYQSNTGEGGKTTVSNLMVFLAFSILLPFVVPFIKTNIKKFKFGGAEIELREQFEQKIQQVRDEASNQHYQHEQALFAIAASLTGSMNPMEELRGSSSKNKFLTIGVLDFAESWILSDLVFRQLIDKGIEVDEPEGAESTLMTFFNMRSGHNDIFVWYSGTAMMMAGVPSNDEIISHTPEEAVEFLNKIYDKWNLKWLQPLGFENREVLVMSREKAKKLNIKTMSDLKDRSDHLVFGANREYFLRGWAYPRLKRAGMRFSELNVIVDIHDRYDGLVTGKFDVGVGWTTDPDITRAEIVAIEPDNQFPSLNQYAIPVCRTEIADRIEGALAGLNISESEIRDLNKQAALAKNNRLAIQSIVEKFFRQM